MSKFLNVGDAYIAIDQIESINNTAIHARMLGKRAVLIRTKSGMTHNAELSVSEIKLMLQHVTGSAWDVQ